MSSLCKDTRPNMWRILFVAPDGSRKTLRLGKMAKRSAEAIQRHVDALLAAKIAGQPMPRETAVWLDGIGQQLRERLAKVGLVDGSKKVFTVVEWIRRYCEDRKTVKPITKVTWGNILRNLSEFFGDEKRLDDVTPADADRFAEYLLTSGLAPATVARRLQMAQQFFRAAVRAKLITENPFADVKKPSMVNTARMRFISREETQRIIAACPNAYWRLIVALARYGGLRCPSEILSLRWTDIDWEKSRMMVTSPKTEHHGKGTRLVPIFPEIHPYLDEVFEVSELGAEWVFPEEMRRGALGPTGWKGCNLRTQFVRIVKRAGFTPWPRLFQNLRSSRETELVEQFPVHVVTAWLGNTPTIAMKHYLQVTDDHFAMAVRGAKSGALDAQNPAQQLRAGSGMEMKKECVSSDLETGSANVCHSIQNSANTPNGRWPTRTADFHLVRVAL